MLDIPKVSKRTLKTLEAAGWTVEKLAVAEPEELTVLDGVGPTTAWRVIVAARRLQRAEVATWPVAVDAQWLTPVEPPPARGLYTAPPPKAEPPWLKDMSVDEMAAKLNELAPGTEIPPMAVRVKRVWLRNKLMELV